MCTSTQLALDLFHLLLFRDNGAELLLADSREGFSLPVVPASRRARLAPQITAAIEKSWNLKAYCLFIPSSLPPSCDSFHFHLAELCSPRAPTTAGMCWLPLGSLCAADFQEPGEYAAIQCSVEQLERYRKGDLPGNFGKQSWLPEVMDWVRTEARKLGISLTGNFRQLNASPTFSLIRFETDGPALWFKAVGEPNLREYSITEYLSSHFAAYLPRMIALRAAWHTWLSVEAPGAKLGAQGPVPAWTIVAQTLAKLETASLGQPLHLIDAGCNDMRARTLMTTTGPFFEVMVEVMARQKKESPVPLSRVDLDDLRAQVEEVLSELAESNAPSTIAHLDFNLSNIIVDRSRCFFLDWAEGCVAHPFLTVQFLREQFLRLPGTTAEREKEFLSAYIAPWQDILSSKVIRTGLRIAPVVAIFAYAVRSLSFLNHEGLHSEIEKFLRSLTRHMKREAGALSNWRLRCVR